MVAAQILNMLLTQELVLKMIEPKSKNQLTKQA